MHASDLIPDVFHYYSDYDAWLQYAISLSRNRDRYRFSKIIAIEMEACRDVTEALTAVHTTRQWLRESSRSYDSHRREELPLTNNTEAGSPGNASFVEAVVKSRNIATPKERNPKTITSDENYSDSDFLNVGGALLVVDLGSSTRELQQPAKLERVVRSLCELVLNRGGSVMSFTGDGCIALFEKRHFLSEREMTNSALEVALELFHEVESITGSQEVTVRAALHYGMTYIPTSGQLRDQIIGRNVVCATRLCDWLGKVIEPGQWKSERKTLIAATGDFLKATGVRVPSADPGNFHTQVSCDISVTKIWKFWGRERLKGMEEEEIEVYRLVDSIEQIYTYKAASTTVTP